MCIINAKKPVSVTELQLQDLIFFLCALNPLMGLGFSTEVIRLNAACAFQQLAFTATISPLTITLSLAPAIYRNLDTGPSTLSPTPCPIGPCK